MTKASSFLCTGALACPKASRSLQNFIMDLRELKPDRAALLVRVAFWDLGSWGLGFRV